jgi:hypothetical protein
MPKERIPPIEILIEQLLRQGERFKGQFHTLIILEYKEHLYPGIIMFRREILLRRK